MKIYIQPIQTLSRMKMMLPNNHNTLFHKRIFYTCKSHFHNPFVNDKSLERGVNTVKIYVLGNKV